MGRSHYKSFVQVLQLIECVIACQKKVNLTARVTKRSRGYVFAAETAILQNTDVIMTLDSSSPPEELLSLLRSPRLTIKTCQHVTP